MFDYLIKKIGGFMKSLRIELNISLVCMMVFSGCTIRQKPRVIVYDYVNDLDGNYVDNQSNQIEEKKLFYDDRNRQWVVEFKYNGSSKKAAYFISYIMDDGKRHETKPQKMEFGVNRCYLSEARDLNFKPKVKCLQTGLYGGMLFEIIETQEDKSLN
jgi:hypothetical protein